MERAERGRGGMRPEDQRTIQTLEKAVNAVVDHLETTERRTDDTLGEIRETLASLSNRVENAEQEAEREEAKKRAQALEGTLMQLANRLEKMEHGVSGIGPQAVEAALKAIEEKSSAENQRAAIERLQSNIEKMAERLERTESRTDETVKTFESSVTNIARKLEDLDRSHRTEVPEALAQRFEQMAQRLEHNERLTMEAAQTVEKAIAGIGENLSATEGRDREALTSLQAMIERMTSQAEPSRKGNEGRQGAGNAVAAAQCGQRRRRLSARRSRFRSAEFRCAADDVAGDRQQSGAVLRTERLGPRL